MQLMRMFFVSALAALFVGASAQAWVKPYENGLRAAKSGDWESARSNFLEAAKHRAEDSDQASTVGSSVADRKPWRNGAPYSPNFGAAYASFKLASEAPSSEVRKAHLADAITGFRGLNEKAKNSVEALVFLAASLTANGELREAAQVQERLQSTDPEKAFKVDRDILDAADLRTIQALTTPAGVTGAAPGVPNPGALPAVGVGTRFGLVPSLDYKYALLIGNSTSGNSFAENDVDLLKDALVRHAGYPEANIVVLKNASVQTIREQAAALADKMPDSGTLFLFFSGGGAFDPESRKDYLAGSDTQSLMNYGRMLPKVSLYEPFFPKGTSIFAFYQVDRPLTNEGFYFGLETPQVGRISQMQGAAPGERAYATVADGKSHGVFAYAMMQVFAEMRNNRIPLMDFAWNTFYRMRNGVGDVGGGSQTPTLPVIVSMSNTARF